MVWIFWGQLADRLPRGLYSPEPADNVAEMGVAGRMRESLVAVMVALPPKKPNGKEQRKVCLHQNPHKDWTTVALIIAKGIFPQNRPLHRWMQGWTRFTLGT